MFQTTNQNQSRSPHSFQSMHETNLAVKGCVGLGRGMHRLNKKLGDLRLGIFTSFAPGVLCASLEHLRKQPHENPTTLERDGCGHP